MSIAWLRRALLFAFGVLTMALAGTLGWALADDKPAQEAGLVGPAINDHWHAALAMFIDDERQPNIPTFTGPEEVHTHGDGIIHMHPLIPAGEGRGAAIGKFFQYGGGQLSENTLRIPGPREILRTGALQILSADSGIHPLGSGFADAIETCDGLPESRFEEVTPEYIPQDGDCLRIVFRSQ